MSIARTRLAAYLAAEQKVLAGQEARIDGPAGPSHLRLPDLAEIRRQIDLLRAQVAAEDAAAAGVPTIGGLSFAVARFDTRRG